MNEDKNMVEQPKLTDPKVRPDKMFKAIALILVAGVIFGTIGYFYGTKQGELKTPDKPIASSVIVGEPTETPIVTTAADITANWKTYTNTDIGVSFKYPADWKEPQLIKHESEPKEAEGIKGHIYTNADNNGTIYPDKFNMFRFSTSSKDYTSFFNDPILSNKINYDWTEEEFNQNLLKGKSLKLEFFKKLDKNVILIGTYGNMECSQSLNVSILTPLNDEYPNFEISIDGKYETDPIIPAAEDKAQSENKDVCDLESAYNQVAQKVKNGNYSNDVNQSIETAKQIALTLKSTK